MVKLCHQTHFNAIKRIRMRANDRRAGARGGVRQAIGVPDPELAKYAWPNPFDHEEFGEFQLFEWLEL